MAAQVCSVLKGHRDHWKICAEPPWEILRFWVENPQPPETSDELNMLKPWPIVPSSYYYTKQVVSR